MSKKVLIDKQALIDELMKIPGVGSNSDALKTIKRLPSYEPQKVKVPELPSKIAKYLEWAKEEKFDFTEDYNMISWEDLRKFGGDDTEYLQMWFFDNDQKENERRHILFLQAYTDGYEVEEEPKWKIINDDKYCLTSIEAGYGNSLHWAFDSTKKKPILFDNEETAMYTAYITGGIVEKV